MAEALSSRTELTRLRLVLFGPMEAWGPGAATVLPRGRKTQALLALLAIEAAPVPRRRLAAMLWSRVGEEQARGSLRQALLELQSALARIPGPPLLRAEREEVMLDPAARWVDAEQVMAADAGHPAALDLMRAPLLPGLDGLDPAFDHWLAARRTGLAATATGLARLLLARSPGEAAARRLLALDARDETAAALVIAARVAAGDAEAARATLAALRAALLPLGRQPSPEIEVLLLPRAANDPAPPPSEPQRLPARRGARLGVLPLTAGPGAEWVAGALAESLTAALARFRWLFLADPASLAAAVRQGTAGPIAAARGAGLDLALSGQVQGGARLRVSLRLTDLRPPETVVWAESFEAVPAELGGLEEGIAAAVVARVDPELLLLEARRASAAPHSDPSSYELLLRAIPGLAALDRPGFEASGQLLARACAADPGFASAQAWHAAWHLFQVGQGWAPDQAKAMLKAEALARRAIALDPADAQALTICGHVRAYLHHLPEEGAALHDRALALNPNLAMAWVFSGLAETYCGRHEEALRRLARYKALAPLHPFAFFFDAAALVPLMLLRRHAEAAVAARAVCELNPVFSFPLRPWLACLGHLGDAAAARAVRGRLLALEPGLTIAAAMRRAPLRPPDAEHYIEGLRRAGLEEGLAEKGVA
ncbi:DNA-binding SARP family transcriptional activator [Humitalea rosea]|uniref:DNA-binding SARP family transcriptional activator n=1 Tax=Humitalea rosea TaxID=990373 RepID=A0A2W7KL77_9PROT|nr:hypothetical protein [Humitalea rosea]PZW49068.1 DNA-binding SARP family transcriptional activator [Humitalea rosea]